MSAYLGFQTKELQVEYLIDEVKDLRKEVEALKSQVTELLNERDNGEEEK
jgi:ubiquinone biosynthesis protein UbiJ